MLWETGRLSFNERKHIVAAYGIFVNSQISSFGTTIFIISCLSIALFSQFATYSYQRACEELGNLNKQILAYSSEGKL